MTYYSRNTPSFDDENSIYPVEFLNEYQSNNLPQHKLKLKKNAVIMLLRNINTSQGLCNGTKLIISEFKKHVIEAKNITGKNVGTKVYILRITFQTDHTDAICLKRQQFSVRLAFCMTINKSQGQTIKKAGILIDSPFMDIYILPCQESVTNFI